MPFAISPDTRFTLSLDLVLAILSSPQRKGEVFTVTSLLLELDRIGLPFTAGELNPILTQLIVLGNLIEVP